MVWRNGYIPESDLVIFRRGRNATDGDWYWGLTPATYARHLALVARAKARTGRTLEPGDGWSTYRPYAAQVIARRIHGIYAAVEGTSSHGGYWEGRETLAVDYSNWSWVYGGDRAAFYDDCRAVGLTPGMIEPRRGYPDEPWHVIDMNPRSGAPASSNATPFEEDDMYANDPELRARLDQIVEFIGANFVGLTGKVGGEGDQTRKHVDARINDLAGWTRDDAQATRAAIAGLAVAGTDPVKIAEAIVPLIPKGASAKDVADEIARRMAS